MLERPDDPKVPAVRINDNDRNQVIEMLRTHTGDGTLTLDEFSDRVTLVFEATTRAELELVTSDLPTPQQQSAAPLTKRRKITRWAVAVMGGHSPRGRFRLADTTNAVAVMGGCELDLRNAEIDGDEVEINCFALMGGVEIIVPEGIRVDFSGLPVMGGTDCKINPDVPIIPGSPRIVVRALAVMGGVTVRSKPPREQEKQRRADREVERARRHAEFHDRRAERREAFRGRRDQRAGRLPSPPESLADGPREPRALRSPYRAAAIERVAAAVQDEWPTLRARAAPDGTVTIMFSDIEGYTAMTERLGDRRSGEILRRHNEIVRKALAEHGGFEVKSQGDGFMVAFGGASRALRCAAAIQDALDAHNAANPDEPVRVRMGLHTGEAIKEADDFLGRCVILASRIANEAEGGEILVSSVLRELTAGTGEFTFERRRKVELKGMSDPQVVYSLVWDAEGS
ncbi:MAG TPA: adenylate/guanylate cyclase domain-containing protein [Acidimicrobiales bacterium]|nr:adenylate/guanylate cyclase domain-containing protein [Acidimicrobiales bacterium]